MTWRPEVDWSKARRAGRPRPCVHGCGHPAWLIPPGSDSPAHKACADKAAGIVTPDVMPGAGEDAGGAKVEPRPLGCGTPQAGQTSGKACAVVTGPTASIGSSPSCQLCPGSPTYWRGVPDATGDDSG